MCKCSGRNVAGDHPRRDAVRIRVADSRVEIRGVRSGSGGGFLAPRKWVMSSFVVVTALLRDSSRRLPRKGFLGENAGFLVTEPRRCPLSLPRAEIIEEGT